MILRTRLKKGNGRLGTASDRKVVFISQRKEICMYTRLACCPGKDARILFRLNYSIQTLALGCDTIVGTIFYLAKVNTVPC